MTLLFSQFLAAYSFLSSRVVGAPSSTIAAALPVCTVQSEPNPIAAMYPNSVTGTVNGTITVLPISYALARKIVPAKYEILSSYRSLIPELDDDLYPLIMETVADHDIQIQAFGFSLPDFLSIRFSFPSVDLLGDGYSHFRYAPVLFLAPNPITVGGALAYGQKVVPSGFNPSCAGYASVADKAGRVRHQHSNKAEEERKNEDLKKIFFDAFAVTDLGQRSPLVAATFSPYDGAEEVPYPLEFFKNATNQPIFANGLACDKFTRLFNTSLSMGRNAPVPIKGHVVLNSNDVLPGPRTVEKVFGFKLDTAFIESNVTCESLKGYSGP